MKRILLLIVLLCSQFIYSETSTDDVKVTYRIEENAEAKSKTLIFTLKGLDIIRLYYVNNTFQKAEISEDLKTKDRIVTEDYFMNFSMLPKKLRKIHTEDKDGNIIKEYNESNIKKQFVCKWVAEPNETMGENKCEDIFYKYNVGSYEEKDNMELYKNKKWSKLLNENNLEKFKNFYATKMAFVNKEDIKVKSIKKDGNILEMTYVSKTTKNSKKESSYFVGTKDNKYMLVNKEDFIKDKILKYDGEVRNYELCEAYTPLISDVFDMNCSKDLSIWLSFDEAAGRGSVIIYFKSGSSYKNTIYYVETSHVIEDPIFERTYSEPYSDDKYTVDFLQRLY